MNIKNDKITFDHRLHLAKNKLSPATMFLHQHSAIVRLNTTGNGILITLTIFFMRLCGSSAYVGMAWIVH